MVGEAYAHVQGESLKAYAALLTEASQLPDHQGELAINPRLRFLILMVTAIGWLVAVFGGTVPAATIRLLDLGTQAVVTVEGDIVVGDYERFDQVAEQGLALGKPVAGIWLNSGGGNFAEAAKIADMFFSLRQAVADKPGAALVVGFEQTCASACFLIFACAQLRMVDATARIGIHSARNSNDNREDSGAFAADTAMARIAKQCGVPDYLIAKLVTTPADSMYWLTELDLHSMGVDVKPSDHVLALPGYPGSERQAPTSPTKQAPTSQTQYTGRVHLTENLTLRAGPDPHAEKVIVGPPLNDAIPKDATVTLRYTDLHTGCRRYDVSGPVHAIWCQLTYDKHQGWVNALYLETGGGPLSCLVDRTSIGCAPVRQSYQTPPQQDKREQCKGKAKAARFFCILGGYDPAYCLEYSLRVQQVCERG